MKKALARIGIAVAMICMVWAGCLVGLFGQVLLYVVGAAVGLGDVGMQVLFALLVVGSIAFAVGVMRRMDGLARAFVIAFAVGVIGYLVWMAIMATTS